MIRCQKARAPIPACRLGQVLSAVGACPFTALEHGYRTLVTLGGRFFMRSANGLGLGRAALPQVDG